MIRALAAVALALTACLGSAGHVCDDGTLCPDNATCATVGGRTRCVTGDQRARCADQADGVTCELAGQPGGVCHDSVCVRAGCGDGLVTGAEQCDGDDLGPTDTDGDGAIDCRDLGFYSAGALACLPDCTFDRDTCIGAGRCGDGEVNGNEECDGAALPLGAACEAYAVAAGSSTMFHPGGQVACGVQCTLTFADCTGGSCGDNVKQASEACDGFDVGTATCAPYSGNVTCSTDCAQVTHACAGSCGDAIVNGPERCDPGATPHAMPIGLGCSTFGFYAGAPSCSSECGAIDLAACDGYCGDGVIQDNEACDGMDQAGADCSVFGGRGALGCTAFCQRDFATCQSGGWQRRAQALPTPSFAAVWSQHGDAAFAVGQAMVHEWNGRTWIDHGVKPGAMLPPSVLWSAVWGDAYHVWIGAGEGLIYRYEPLLATTTGHGVWIAEVIGGPGVFGLWGDGTTLYAATSNGVYRRAISGSWVLEPATTGAQYHAIHGRGGSVVAAGPFGAIRKLGANAWTPLAAPGTWRYVSVWSSSTIWLASEHHAAVYVERDSAPPEVRTLVLPPTMFGPTPPLVRGIFAVASDDVYVPVRSPTNALLRWTGDHQSGAPVLVQVSVGTLPSLGGIGGSGAGDVWVLAAGATFHHDGAGWQAPVLPFADPAPVLPPIEHATVAVTPDRVWFGGRAGNDTALLAYDTANPVPPAASLSTITPGPLTALWASGDVLWLITGNTVTAQVPPSATPPPGTTIVPAAVGAWGADAHLYVAAQQSHVAHFDGASWTDEPLPTGGLPISIRAIAGSSPSDVWVGGMTLGDPFGAVFFHRDQVGWQAVPAPATVGEITTLWSAARDDAWAAGRTSNGDLVRTVLLHWNGAGWQVWPGTELASTEITSIWGSGPFDIWAVGTTGTVLHYDGQRWTPIPLPTFEHLRAVHGAGPDDVWTVGDNGARFKLTHRLPVTSPGACAGAVPLYCGDPTPSVGTVFGDAPAFYRFDAPGLPDVTALALAVTSQPDQGVELSVHLATSDARCDLDAAPIAPTTSSDPTAFAFAAQPRATYYIAVRRAPSQAAVANSFTLAATCTYAPDPNP